MTMTQESIGVDAGRKPREDELDIYGMTHTGLVRKTNQDHFLICALQRQLAIYATSLPPETKWPRPERLAFVALVADGVGSSAAGEEASRLTVEGITDYVASSMKCYYKAKSADDTPFSDELEEAAMQVHEAIVARAKDDDERRRMATTLTLWLGVWPRAYLLQVGDSRCYMLRGGQELVQISRDQTMAQELIDQGILSRAEAPRTRWANVLSSAIGGHQTAPVVTRMDLTWEDTGLLCSDGLTKHVSDEKIAERLRTMTSAKQVCEDLVQDALDDGGTDNITVLVARPVRRPEP